MRCKYCASTNLSEPQPYRSWITRKCMDCDKIDFDAHPVVNTDYAQLNAWRRRVERENTTSINPEPPPPNID